MREKLLALVLAAVDLSVVLVWGIDLINRVVGLTDPYNFTPYGQAMLQIGVCSAVALSVIFVLTFFVERLWNWKIYSRIHQLETQIGSGAHA